MGGVAAGGSITAPEEGANLRGDPMGGWDLGEGQGIVVFNCCDFCVFCTLTSLLTSCKVSTQAPSWVPGHGRGHGVLGGDGHRHQPAQG